jgi:CubicO group peptidase (beta-lactamase class C family)
MRRVLTILTAIVLLAVSLGIGVFTADLPFWRRALQLPLAPDTTYLPVALLVPGTAADARAEGQPAMVPVIAQTPSFDELVVEEAANRARALGSRALLVLHQRQLVVERYFVADDASSLLPATVIARPIAAMAAGIAMADEGITLDAPVSRLLHEWEGEPRGRITLRQLLEETSGLEVGGDLRNLLHRSPLQDLAELPRFATSRGVRMLLGNDYTASALNFRLEHEPGGFYHVSPANTQLAAVMIERATKQPYETFVEQNIWRAVGTGTAELQLDRRSGMPAAHCCWRATARDMLRVAALLGTDGASNGRQVLPVGWVAEMTRPSRVSAGTGLQVNLLRIEGEAAYELRDEQGSAIWVIPGRGLNILTVANPGDQVTGELRELPALLVRGLVAR